MSLLVGMKLGYLDIDIAFAQAHPRTCLSIQEGG